MWHVIHWGGKQLFIKTAFKRCTIIIIIIIIINVYPAAAWWSRGTCS